MPVDFFQTLPASLIPARCLSRWMGALADIRTPAIKNFFIRTFIRRYGVNMAEALHARPEDYDTFNDFFTRQLKPQCRPQANAGIVSPVDGCVSQIGRIDENRLIQAKGHSYTLEALLANDPLTPAFTDGFFTTLYLSPRDYHRIHMPLAGRLTHMTYIPGSLFSVKPKTVNAIPGIFARNERLALYFDTAHGPLALVMVGAVIVGSIATSWEGDITRGNHVWTRRYDSASDLSLDKGASVGYFKLGSTVIVLLGKTSQATWNHSLTEGSAVRVGEVLGEFA
ncbi:phosphatidylserine decarboxylase [Legionella geestiana]|uniref:Phosphatidylserine decarboxylase proenzyme n=1 Tax=Legionella geestiana TaxID=45065 RepID=A0A0W0U9J6_9GAMM|nr:archaetidylserine decarboxylase [Legionella geestiana]KTD04475.1 phosphatidylserine decarboxylase [Legionella geestiana]QBS13406.1 phosphatidylserine decarboxylase [Legionella geestiana]QDQ40042.1 phosphatidylserine decarboxylase [Legionella geestiana]STX53021.1 phosphatidylserine decarboxylase [Legionella geestiana]